jgi:hypothetical protein
MLGKSDDRGFQCFLIILDGRKQNRENGIVKTSSGIFPTYENQT